MRDLKIRLVFLFLLLARTTLALEIVPASTESRIESLEHTPIITSADKQWMLEQTQALKALNPLRECGSACETETSIEKVNNNDVALQDKHALQPPSSPGLLVFISFSLSEESLKAWVAQTQRAGGTLVLRGLVQNSLKKTLAELIRVLSADNVQALNIDPLAFKRFSVETVPAVVITNSNQPFLDLEQPSEQPSPSSAPQNFDIIYGDVGLSYALKKIIEEGEQSTLASTYLEALERRP